MDSFLHNHQAALDSQREAQAIRDKYGDEDDKYFNHEYDYEDDDFFDDWNTFFPFAMWLLSGWLFPNKRSIWSFS